MSVEAQKLSFVSFLVGLSVIGVFLHLNLIRFPSFVLLENNELFNQLIKLAAWCFFFYLLWKRYEYCKRFNRLPGLKTIFGLIGHPYYFLPTLYRHKLITVAITEGMDAVHNFSLSEKGGKGLFAGWFLTKPYVFVSSPEHIRIIFNDYGDLPKAKLYDLSRPLFGDGLFNSNGEKWQYHRKLLTPTFNFTVLGTFMDNLRKNNQVLMANFEQEASSHPERIVANIAKYIFPCAMDILGESSMGINIGVQNDPNCAINHSFHRLLSALSVMSALPWFYINKFFWVRPFTSFGRKCNRHLRIFHEKSNELIEQRFNHFKNNVDYYADPNNNKKEPFINTLFREHLQRPKEFPMDCVRDEVNTFLAAGHDTAGWAFTYALFMIGHHPEAQAKVHEEVDTFFSHFESEEDIQIESLKELKYTNAVVKETLRLYPTVPVIMRTADRDLNLGQYVIPKGAEIVISLKHAHQDPEYWAEPARFRPERFLDTKLSHPYAYVPFSGGPRNCVGQKYAMVQLKMSLALIMKHYTIQSLDPIESVLIYGPPIACANSPIRIKFIKREQ